jgi:hypothetical protein
MQRILCPSSLQLVVCNAENIVLNLMVPERNASLFHDRLVYGSLTQAYIGVCPIWHSHNGAVATVEQNCPNHFSSLLIREF